MCIGLHSEISLTIFSAADFVEFHNSRMFLVTFNYPRVCTCTTMSVKMDGVNRYLWCTQGEITDQVHTYIICHIMLNPLLCNFTLQSRLVEFCSLSDSRYQPCLRNNYSWCMFLVVVCRQIVLDCVDYDLSTNKASKTTEFRSIKWGYQSDN